MNNLETNCEWIDTIAQDLYGRHVEIMDKFESSAGKDRYLREVAKEAYYAAEAFLRYREERKERKERKDT